VDADLIGEDGRPIEGYTFASIQSLQTEDLSIGEGFNALALAIDEWLYAYEGKTTLEMAVFNRINEVRAEHNLPPLVHDPLLSVGARYRTAYHERVLPRDVRIDNHDVGTITTGAVRALLNTTGGDVGIFTGALGAGTYSERAVTIVNRWLNSTTGHREAVLSNRQARIGIGISSRGTYAFLGTP